MQFVEGSLMDLRTQLQAETKDEQKIRTVSYELTSEIIKLP